MFAFSCASERRPAEAGRRRADSLTAVVVLRRAVGLAEPLVEAGRHLPAQVAMVIQPRPGINRLIWSPTADCSSRSSNLRFYMLLNILIPTVGYFTDAKYAA